MNNASILLIIGKVGITIFHGLAIYAILTNLSVVNISNSQLLRTGKSRYDNMCARSRYLGQEQVITHHNICYCSCMIAAGGGDVEY